jgi:hypothetical protein
MRKNVAREWVALAVCPALAACSANGESAGTDGAPQASSPNGGTSGSATSGTGGNGFDPGSGGGGGESGEGEPCAVAKVKAVKRPVDIIWVVDQSGSMNDEIDQVKSNINVNFADILSMSALDYRVVLIAGAGKSGDLFDVNPLCVSPPLGGPSCGAPNPPLFFHSGQHVESNDSLHWIIETYDSPDPAKRWRDAIRFESMKVFVEVTDDNAMAINFPPLVVGINAQEFQQKLHALDPPNVFGTSAQPKYVFHSIVGVDKPYGPADPVTPANKRCASAVNSGVEYQTLSVATGGLRYPVCEPDYSSVFQEIAKGIAASLECELALESTGEGQIDPTKVNVVYTPGGGMPQYIYKDDSAPCGAGANGWQFKDASYAVIVLCGEACAKVQGDPDGSIEVEVGCDTKTPPPK